MNYEMTLMEYLIGWVTLLPPIYIIKKNFHWINKYIFLKKERESWNEYLKKKTKKKKKKRQTWGNDCRGILWIYCLHSHNSSSGAVKKRMGIFKSMVSWHTFDRPRNRLKIAIICTSYSVYRRGDMHRQNRYFSSVRKDP